MRCIRRSSSVVPPFIPCLPKRQLGLVDVPRTPAARQLVTVAAPAATPASQPGQEAALLAPPARAVRLGEQEQPVEAEQQHDRGGYVDHSHVRHTLPSSAAADSPPSLASTPCSRSAGSRDLRTCPARGCRHAGETIAPSCRPPPAWTCPVPAVRPLPACAWPRGGPSGGACRWWPSCACGP